MDVIFSCTGLIFDESVGPDRTLEPEQTKPKVTLVEDPKQSQVYRYSTFCVLDCLINSTKTSTRSVISLPDAAKTALESESR